MLDSHNSSTGGASRGNESREDDDNFRAANGGQEADDDDADEEGFFNMQRPTSWGELFSMILKQNEERLLTLQNPDGLLYLTYLKQSALVFLISK